MPALILDFETASACDLKKCGAHRYAEDPTTEVLSLSWGYEHVRPVGSWTPAEGKEMPRALVDALEDERVLFTAHNADFEKAIWRKIMVAQFGWPNAPNSKWHDTKAVCAMRGVLLDLDGACRTLHLPYQKDKAGSKLTIGFSKTNKRGYYERDPADLERSVIYNVSDINAQRSLHERIGWLPEGERRVWLLNQRMNERGFMLDMPLVRNMQRIVDKATGPLAKEFEELTGGLGFNQGAKIIAWCQEQGFALPNMQKETLAKLLGDDEVEDEDEELYGMGHNGGPIMIPEPVERALKIRQLVGSASVKKLAAMERCVCADGRVRGTIQYHGTGPGRAAGRLMQPHNFPRGTNEMIEMAPEDKVALIMEGDPDLIEMATGIPAVEFVVGSLRHTIQAESGRQIVSGDYTGIQARTVLALAGQYDKCEVLAKGHDPYIDMALQIYDHLPRIDLGDKVAVKKFKQEHTAERQTGKNSVLGLGFQMGAPKFHFKYCPDQPFEFAQSVVDAYRKRWAPNVPEVWYGLQEAALETAIMGLPNEAYGVTYRREDNWLTAELISGRKLWYYNPKVFEKTMPWSTFEKPDIRTAWSFQARKNGHMVTVDAFGGQLTENVVMGIERDLMTVAQFKLEDEGIPLVLEVHDENVGEPKLRPDAEEVVRQVMEDVPDWARQLRIPIHVDTWTGDRYRK